jgi:hypothetical protein
MRAPLVSRRLFLGGLSVPLATAVWHLLESEASVAHASLTPMQSGWRFCNKCQVMFFTRLSAGACAAGGAHVAQGYLFNMFVDAPPTANRQTNWRCCRKCQTMFFNGYQAKGRCPAGQAHVADTRFRYGLPHDVPGTPTAQTEWRFCNKCFAMFYDGYPARGSCPTGGAHVAQGYMFVLPHDRP